MRREGPAAELAVSAGVSALPRGPRCLPAWSPSCLQEADGMRCRCVEWTGAVGVYSEDTRGDDTSGPRAPTGPFPPPRCPPCVLLPWSSLESLFKQSLGSLPFGHPILMGRVPTPCPAEPWGPGPSPGTPLLGPRPPRQRRGRGLVLRRQPSPSELVAAHLVSWT